MYVRRVVLENIRGFSNLNFNFERTDKKYAGWSVVTGDNGSGKSALLKAIAFAISGRMRGRILQNTLAGWIKKGKNSGIIAVQLVVNKDEDFFTGGGRTSSEPIWAELHLKKNTTPEPALVEGKDYVKRNRGATRGPWVDNPIGWFCCGYGPFRRLYGSSSEAARMMAGPPSISRFGSMFREDADLSECEIWLKDLYNQGRDGKAESEEVLSSVRRLLEDEFLQNEIEIDAIDNSGLKLRDSAGTTLPLADMSDGYRAALAILTDICRNMVLTYGANDLVEDDGNGPRVTRSGVVLIDEIDAHLHPEWQRTIGFWLKRRFPNIQFIVTTHSPIICQAADEPCIYRLPAPGSEERPFQLGKSQYWEVVRAKSDTILLSPAFGLEHTRSPLAVEKMTRHAELQSKKRTANLSREEKEESKQLELWSRD